MEFTFAISLAANAILIYPLNKTPDAKKQEIKRDVKIRDEECKNLLFEYMTEVNNGDKIQSVKDLNDFLIFAKSKDFFDRY
ncbi:hypothetical protein L0663_04275 [Dyadobacter sp. CY107]|uniref:hypothetical protein n=1 Tax=Dyadobacter fanqingshengii TaxID=2906443 RepID=UPI001F1739F2|nr:hypothetical protein [Dyadobacter fanqingshengii]MCF2502581.1 hypothetical protein [Dyadobacter fanqingshengii]